MNSPLIRQAFVSTTTQLTAISLGGALGYPCVLLQQFKSNESSIRPDLDTSTWIVSTFGISGIPSIFMPSIMQLRGRKFSFITSCLLLTIGWILTYTSKTTTALVVAAMFCGLGSNCVSIVNLLTVSEMIGPKYRTVTLIMLGVNQSIGMTLVTVIGNFVHWKMISIIMCFPTISASLMVFFWPESPSWLAYKGSFDECEKAFKWLRGNDNEAMKEIDALISAQKEIRRRVSKKTPVKEWFAQLIKKDFYLPNFYMFLILSYFYLSGALCLYIYSQQILEEGTKSPTAAQYGYFYRDASLVIGSFIAIVLVRLLKSKSVLLLTSAGCILSLLCCFIITYLQFIDVLSKNSLLLIYSFSVYMTFCNSGFNFITFALSAELMPVKHRGIGGALIIIYTCSFHAISGKVFPYLVMYLNLWGMFLIFAILGIIEGALIWWLVPETKNRTLQEIEDCYNNGDFVRTLDYDNASVHMINDKEYE